MESMTFASPEYLALLGTLPIVGLLLLYEAWRRRRLAGQFAQSEMLVRLAPRGSWLRTACRGFLLLLGLAALILALARPQWGEAFEDLPSRGLDLFVLLDVSRSMQAEDVSPNRLARAKADIRDLLTRLEGDRIGLIIFAGAALVRVPLTTDQAFYRGVLDDIEIQDVPRGGTQIGAAIRRALEAMPPRATRDQLLVLITDGEDHESDPRAAAALAAQRNVKIITVGLGDAREGGRIPVRDSRGGLRYLQYDGTEVWSRMDEPLLRDIARQTNGIYIPAQTRQYDLGQILETQLSRLTRGEITTTRRKRKLDRFTWFLALGLTCLLSESLIFRTPRGPLPALPLPRGATR